MKKNNTKEIWSDNRYGTCRLCESPILIPGLDAYLCLSKSCGWQETVWGEAYYKALEKKEKERKAKQREARQAQKELTRREEKRTWGKNSGMSQLEIFEYQID